MKLRAVQISLIAALLGVSSIQAVVVAGPQQLGINNRNGYRYNGPAHKYLPAEEHHHHQQEQQHLDHQQQEQPQGFSGPFNKEYYEGQRHREQQEENSWQSAFSQQQGHQQQGHQQHHQINQINQISGYQPPQEGSGHLQHNQPQHQISGGHRDSYNSYQQQQQGLGHQQISGQNHKEHSYEPAYSQQQQHPHQEPGGLESWNSNRGQGLHQQQQNEYSQRGESWQGQPGHGGLGGGQAWNPNRGVNENTQQRGETWQQLTSAESFNSGGQGQGSLAGAESWQPNRGQLEHNQQRGEAWPGSSQSHGYGQQHQKQLGDSLWHPIGEHELEKLQRPTAVAHASSQKTIARPGGDVKLVPSFSLSSDAEHDRFIGLDAQDTRLLIQGLPNAYRKQAFSSPIQSSGKDFLQMQSQSYQLPSTHSTHREWPQQDQQGGSFSGGHRQYSITPQSSPAYQNGVSHPSREFQAPYY